MSSLPINSRVQSVLQIAGLMLLLLVSMDYKARADAGTEQN